MSQGIVKWFDAVEGQGVITPSDLSPELPVQACEVRGFGDWTLVPEQRVSYTVGTGEQGPIATMVNILSRQRRA